jgi:hypothetical protein
MKLWNFRRPLHLDEMAIWAGEVKLTHRDRARLNSKLDMLERIGFEQAHGLDFLAGPLKGQRHIYKLVIHSDRMLRPMLCLGPIDNSQEMTLLCGAIEKDWTLHPANAPERAESNRLDLLDKDKQPPWRVDHERF